MLSKGLYTSIPVFVVSFVVAYLLFFTGCGGIVEVYGSLLLVGGLSLFLISYYIYSIIIYFIYKEKVNLRPLLFSLASLLIFVSFFYLRSKRKEDKVNLSASNRKAYRAIDLRLKENNEIEIYYGHIEEKCSCTGKYVLRGDTLIINEIEWPKKLEISSKYLITQLYLIPIKGNELESDSSKYLKRHY
jgi:hypothetical protein